MTKKQKSEFIRGAEHGFFYLGGFVDYGFTLSFKTYLKGKAIDAKKHDIAKVLTQNGHSTEYAEGYKMAFYLAEGLDDRKAQKAKDITLKQYLNQSVTSHIRTISLNQLV